MSYSMQNWGRIHNKTGLSFLSIPLLFASLPYKVAVKLRTLAYYHGILRQKHLPGIVISIGNITTGGTGKTPAVMMMAGWAIRDGYNVAVLSRGYGGNYKQDILEVSDGRQVLAGPEEAGDEPFLLATRLKGVVVIVSKNRYQAGLQAIRKYGSNFFILDDGFQHIQLARDVDIVLVDASNPFGNRHLLPWGPLREPVSHIRRAHICVFTHGPDIPQETMRKIYSYNKNISFFFARHLPEEIVFPNSKRTKQIDFLEKKSVVAFAGIAHPTAFKKTLLDQGANILYFKGFPDHYSFTEADVNFLLEQKKRLGAEYLITTEKDWSRLIPFCRDRSDIAILRIKFAIIPEQRGTFFNRLDEIVKNKTDG